MRLFLLLLIITSCNNVPVVEKLFCVDAAITEKKLTDKGYNVMGSTKKGKIYTNVPYGLYEFGSSKRNGKQAQTVIDDLNGNEVTYYLNKGKIEKREILHYGEEFKDKGRFTIKSLNEIMEKENCSCKILSIDTLPNRNTYEFILKNTQGQQHWVRLTTNSIIVESYYKTDSLGTLVSITPPPYRQ